MFFSCCETIKHMHRKMLLTSPVKSLCGANWPWSKNHRLTRVKTIIATDTLKALCMDLNLSYCFLFILLSDLRPWISRQGHQRRLCVFCLQLFCGFFCDEVIVYKNVTPQVRARVLMVIHHLTRGREGWLILWMKWGDVMRTWCLWVSRFGLHIFGSSHILTEACLSSSIPFLSDILIRLEVMACVIKAKLKP